MCSHFIDVYISTFVFFLIPHLPEEFAIILQILHNLLFMCLFSHRASLLEVCKEPHCCSWYITRLLRSKIFSFYTSFVLLLCLMDFTDPKSLGTNGMLNYASCSLFFLVLTGIRTSLLKHFKDAPTYMLNHAKRAYCLSKFTKKSQKNSGWAESPLSQNNMVHFHVKTEIQEISYCKFIRI